MKTLLPAMLLLCSLASAQFPDYNSSAIDTCFNGALYPVIEGWDAYQTLDNTWDGPRDTSVCVQAVYGVNFTYFEASDVDLFRPVFFKADVDTTFEFSPHTLWRASVFANSGVLSNVTDWCNDGYCSGILVELEVPYNDTSWVERRYFGNFENGFGTLHTAELCMPVEYPEQYSRLKTVVVKMFFDESTDVGLGLPWFEDMSLSAVYLDSAGFIPFNNSQFEYFFPWLSNGEDNYVVPYDPSYGFPSDTTPSYVDVAPMPNVDYQSLVTLSFDFGKTLTFEPHAHLRGALIEGSDSLRHDLELVNLGAEVCMPPEFEVVMQPGTGYTHVDGKLAFGYKSCIRFQYHSRLTVAPDAQLVSGSNSQGMLAFDDGAHVKVEENATFEINNGIVFFDSPWITGDQWVDVDVFEGGKIIFRENAYVYSQVPDKRLKWRINLWGGSVDLSGLSAEDREYFVIFGDENVARPDDIVLLGNPIGKELAFSFDVRGATDWQVDIYDKSGAQVLSRMQLQGDADRFVVDTSALAAGYYILKIRGEAGTYSARFVKS